MNVGIFYPKSPFNVMVPSMVAAIASFYSKAISTYMSEKIENLGIDLKFSPATGYKIIPGILYLSSLLKQSGCKVKLYHEDYLRSKNIFDASLKEIAENDCIFILFSTVQYRHVKEICERIRELNPNVPICLSGREPTFLDEMVSRDLPYVIAIRGDCEIIAKDLISALDTSKNPSLNKIRGISWVKNNRFIRNPLAPRPNLDVLPPPDFSILPNEMLKNLTISLTTSRGCPFKCHYCYETYFWDKLRFRSLDKVYEDLSLYFESLPYNHVFFQDSTFTYPKKRVLAFCEMFKELFSDKYFSCNARACTLDRQLIEVLSNANCTGVFMGVENSSENLLRKLDRFESQSTIIRALKILNTEIPFVTCSAITGLPGETYETAVNTIRLLMKILHMGTFQATLRIFVPYPGTPIFHNPSKYALKIMCYDFSRYDRYSFPPVIRLKNLNEIELYSLFLLGLGAIANFAAQRVNLIDEFYQFLISSVENVASSNIYKIVPRNNSS